MQNTDHMTHPGVPAGMKIKQFSAAVGLSRATLYALPPASQPMAVKVGRSRIITESPQSFLKRVGKAA